MNLVDELSRLKGAFDILPVRDDATRTMLINQLETVIRIALDPKSADRYADQLNKINFYPMVAFSGGPDHTPRTWREGTAKVKGLIEAVDHQLRLISAIPASAKTKELSMDSLFIVHGHDQNILRAVEAYVRKVGLKPVVLMDEASAGKTVIEKIVRYGNVPFAIVLLSPDDVGRSVSAKPHAEKRRPRQNAVLELGFFMGKLGRENVCVIVDADLDAGVEYPSDMAGIVTIHFREGGDWKMQLVREFREAGLSFKEAET